MAEGKMTDKDETEEIELEASDVELRNPSVVLSVRLDGATAKALHQLARKRDARMSDLLRDAVAAYVRSGAADQQPHFAVQSRVVSFVVGAPSVWTEQPDQPSEKTGETVAWRTAAA
jgi:hypothetical protein